MIKREKSGEQTRRNKPHGEADSISKTSASFNSNISAGWGGREKTWPKGHNRLAKIASQTREETRPIIKEDGAPL